MTAQPTATQQSAVQPSATQQSATQFHEDGVRLLRERRTEGAIELLRQAVTLEPRSALFVTDLGYAYLLEDRYAEAEEAFKKGISLDPHRPHAYGHLVESVVRSPNRWEKRAELLQILGRALEINQARETRLKIEAASIRAEFSYGLTARAREHLDETLRDSKIPRAIEKQLRELKAAVELEEKARASQDWPEPLLDAAQREALLDCQKLGAPNELKPKTLCLSGLLKKYPAWRAPRRLRAQYLTAQGHYDEAVKDLTILTRLEPSEPNHFRQLGLLLAEHGGMFELERADEALRVAMALEPEWSELEVVRRTLATRRFNTEPQSRVPRSSDVEPTENARRLYEEALGNLEDEKQREGVKDSLERALRESPGYIDAAALLYALSRRSPEKTVQTLWDDAEHLLMLYRQCAHVEPPLPRVVLERWLNRVIELGYPEGRLTRALNYKKQGEEGLAEVELSNYLAEVTNREEVEAVQRLRMELPNTRKIQVNGDADVVLRARLRLRADDLDGALKLLGAQCRSSVDAERLLWLGIAFEKANRVDEALACYEMGGTGPEAQALKPQMMRRMARLFARADPAILRKTTEARLTELSNYEPAANWALARRAFDTGNSAAAKGYILRYLGQVDSEERYVSPARTLLERLRSRERLQEANLLRLRRWWSGSVGLGLVLLACAVYFVRFRGVTVARAIRQKPKVFPEVARIVGELRHDILKHRTSTLEMLSHDPSVISKVRSTLLNPVAASTVVVQAYARLSSTARVEGVTLRRLEAEPTFGRLVKDLRIVERALVDGRNIGALKKLEQRFRKGHPERLQRLLANGPMCLLDAAEVQKWIAAIQAEFEGKRTHWTVPALQMSELSFAFPMDKTSLYGIFSNLLRNAQLASNSQETPRIIVKLLRERDDTGKTWVKVHIGDNAPVCLDEASVDAQVPGRGLAIIRDTTKEWRGRVVLLRAEEPYRQVVGVEFSL